MQAKSHVEQGVFIDPSSSESGHSHCSASLWPNTTGVWSTWSDAIWHLARRLRAILQSQSLAVCPKSGRCASRSPVAWPDFRSTTSTVPPRPPIPRQPSPTSPARSSVQDGRFRLPIGEPRHFAVHFVGRWMTEFPADKGLCRATSDAAGSASRRPARSSRCSSVPNRVWSGDTHLPSLLVSPDARELAGLTHFACRSLRPPCISRLSLTWTAAMLSHPSRSRSTNSRSRPEAADRSY